MSGVVTFAEPTGPMEGFPLEGSYATLTFKVTKVDHVTDHLLFDDSLGISSVDVKPTTHIKAFYEQTRPLLIEWKKHYLEGLRLRYASAEELDLAAPKLFTSWLIRVGRNENVFFALDEEEFDKKTGSIYRERKKHLHIRRESELDDVSEKKWPKFVAFVSDNEFSKSREMATLQEGNVAAGDIFVLDFINGKKIVISQPSLNDRSAVFFYKKKVVLEKRIHRIRSWFPHYDYDGVYVETIDAHGTRDYSYRKYHHFERRSELKTVSGLNHKYYIVGMGDAGTAIKKNVSKYWMELQRSGRTDWKREFYSNYTYKLFASQSIQHVQRMVAQTAQVHGMTVPFSNTEWVSDWLMGMQYHGSSDQQQEIVSESYKAKLVSFSMPMVKAHSLHTKRVAVERSNREANVWWGEDDDLEVYNVNGSFKRAMSAFVDRLSKKDDSLEVKAMGEGGREQAETIDDIWLADGVSEAVKKDDPVPKSSPSDGIASVEDQSDVASDVKFHNKDFDYKSGLMGVSVHDRERDKKVAVAKGVRVKKDMLEGNFANEDLHVSDHRTQSVLQKKYGHESVSFMDLDAATYAPSPLAQPLNVQLTGMAYLDEDFASSRGGDYSSRIGNHQSFTTTVDLGKEKKEKRVILFSKSFDKKGDEDDVSPKWFVIEKDKKYNRDANGSSDYSDKRKKAFRSVVGGYLEDYDNLSSTVNENDRYKATIVTSML